MVKDNILYERLEISPNASETDIKKSFNRLSKIWHPDKRINDDDKNFANQKFVEINQAKEILLDPEKRSQYDQMGMDMLNPENQFANNNPFAGFESMFGNNFPFGVNINKNNEKKIIQDIVKKLDVTLEQIYNEEVINYNYQQKVFCAPCNGEGTSNGIKNICTACNGKGMNIQIIRMGPMIQQAMTNCNICNATGKINDPNNICNICKGLCYTKKSKNIQIPLKAGITHNNRISLAGKGNQYINGKSDLILIINELKHAIFKRYQNDLYLELEIQLYEALFGFNKIINHLDGRKINLVCSNNTDYNSIRIINNEGMKCLQTNNKGNLYIKFIIILPNLLKLDNKIKDELKLILQTNSVNETNSLYNDTEFIDSGKNNDNSMNKVTNLILNNLNDCDKVQSENIIKIFDNILINSTSYDNDESDTFENNTNPNNSNNPGECIQS
uniref:J domain-containing protein n=1 Tax=viral metagenome TaxID=1070528 RepID=A0A6C0EDJ7_9ZZZZ